MARTPDTEQIALQEALLRGSAEDMAQFLLVNSGTMRRFLKLTTDQFGELMDVLQKGAPKAQDAALHFIDDALDRPERLRVRRMTLTPPVKQDVVQAQHQIEAQKSRKARAEKAPISLFAQAWASVMSSWGFDRKERDAIALGFFTPMIAGVAMNAFGAAGTAEAALPVETEPVRAMDTLTERFNTPLELTVTPKKSNPFDAILQGDYKMMPSLIRHMERDAQAKEYVTWCLEASAKSGIDGNLFANQMYKESFWFKPEVIDGRQKSPTGATGIAQFMPGTAKALGVDPLNPKEAIFAAAAFMGKLTRRYGDQHLAMIVYNGRDDALDFVQAELGLEKTPDINQWMEFMQERREKLGTGSRHAWHVETLGYVEQISSDYWDKGVQRVAVIGTTNTANLNLPDIKAIPIPFAAPRSL